MRNQSLGNGAVCGVSAFALLLGAGCSVEMVEESSERVGEITQALTCPPEQAPKWKTSVNYKKGAFVSHQGKIYECLQAHKSQNGWQPTNAPSLWRIPTPCGVTEWAPQTHYQVGSRVTHQGSTFDCIQAHTSVVGWQPPATPALWSLVEGAGTHRVDAFILKRIRSCITGEACTGDVENCFKIWNDAHSQVLRAWEINENFRMVPPGDPAVGTAPAVECLDMDLNASEIAQMRQELELTRSNVFEWTSGALDLELVIHEIEGPVDTTLTPWGTGIFMGPWDVSAVALPELTGAVDFVIVSHAHHDRTRHIHTDIGGCGGTFGADIGLAGAGYSWVPNSRPFFFQCAEQGVYTHEWLHQVHWAVHNLSGFTDLYGGVYPACGAGAADTTLWFPDSHECSQDPDYALCGFGDCGSNDMVNSHILQEHWPANRVLIANHCKNGVQDHGETGIDTGNGCL